MIPDLATIRDRASTGPLARKIYGIVSQRWRGQRADWHHYEAAYGLFAAIATPLVLSVHSVVSSRLRGFVAAGLAQYDLPALFSSPEPSSPGSPWWITVLTIARKAFDLEEYISLDHMELMCKIILATSMMVKLRVPGPRCSWPGTARTRLKATSISGSGSSASTAGRAG